MGETALEQDWQNPAWWNPARKAPMASIAAEAQPLVLVAEEVPVLTPMVEELCAFLRVRALRVPPGALAENLRDHPPVGVLCHSDRTDPALAEALRAVVAFDAGLPVMVVTEHDSSREARLAVAAEIIRLDRLIWLDRLPDLRRMVDFLFLAERRAARSVAAPG
jgi:hypothetical protein